MKNFLKKLWENSGKKFSVIPHLIRNLWQKRGEKMAKIPWKKIFWGTVFAFVLVIIFVSWKELSSWTWWGNNFNLMSSEEKIVLKDFIIGLGALATIIVAFKNWKTSQKNTDNQTQQIQSDKFSRQNQQFLDAVELFKNENLEIKKGALFHLENLALSSPAHRQRVLDFLNSLNAWMRERKDEIKDADFKKWRNEKSVLFIREIRDENQKIIKEGRKIILDGVSDDQQKLSAEIPKIYENIIQKQNEDFSEEEKTKYELNFSYFVFAEIIFLNFVFPQKITDFSNCLFLGATFFTSTKFEGDTLFIETEFLGNVQFLGVKFLRRYVTFERSQFLGLVTAFFGIQFPKGNIDFWKVKISKNLILFAKDFDFRKCSFKTEFSEEKHDFISPENFQKFRDAGALFSDEQIAYFEAKCKEENS